MMEKDSLKEFIGENSGAFASEQMSKGDVERFEAAYRRQSGRIKFRRGGDRRGYSFWRVVLLPVAASLLVVLCFQLFNQAMTGLQKENESVSGVYAHHYEQVEILIGEISYLTAAMGKDECVMYQAVVDDVVYESVSIIELIPEYLPESDKVEIIKEYSFAVCSSLQEIINSINN